MARAIRVLAACPPGTEASDSVVLDSAQRRARRGDLVGVKGTKIALDLPAPIMLAMGDMLALDDGRLIEVVAEAEPLVEVRAAPAVLARLAWLLGDRHVPVQILPNRLRLRRDPAIEALLGGHKVTAVEAPFDPEGGAYRVSATHDHAHHHDHDHHGHDHHDHGPAKPVRG